MEYTQSEIVFAQAVAASTTYTFDLGVQGLSYLWIEIQALQAAANTSVQPDDVLNCLSNISVTAGGASIIAGRGKDLAKLGSLIAGTPIRMSQAANATNGKLGLSFALPFGRRLFDPLEGYPAVKRGMLQISITGAAAFTPVTGPHVTIHQVEVPGNQFRRYNKYTQRTATPAATGYFDFPLPIGNWLRGVYAVGSTLYRDEESLGTFKEAILMVDNAEKYFTGGLVGHANFLANARGKWSPETHVHAHISDVGAAYTQFQETDANPLHTVPITAFSHWLDLDYGRDDAFTLDTRGKNLLALRANMSIAEQAWIYAYESVQAT